MENRVSSALDRLKDLVAEDGGGDDAAGHAAPRNVEEAVDRLKRKVDDKAD